jgi:hypothetical protein
VAGAGADPMADAAPGKLGLKGWLKKYRLEALAGAGVLFAFFALVRKKSASSSAAGTAAADVSLAGQPCTDANGNASVTDATGACTLAAVGDDASTTGPPGDTGPQGGAGVAGAAGKTGATGKAGTNPALEFVGSGYTYVSPGSGKVAVVNAAALAWMAGHAGFDRWYEPELGQYVDVKGHSLKPGTHQFTTPADNTKAEAAIKSSDAKAALAKTKAK